MELLVTQGKVIYVGSSNFAAWQIAQAQGKAEECHFLGLVSEQSLYNLTSRTIELEVIPACRSLGIALLPWSPLAGGLLGGIIERRSPGRRNSERLQDIIEKHRGQLEAFESLCQDLNISPAEVALAWVMKNPDVTATIIGPRTIDQLGGCMKAFEVHLSDDTMKQLDQIWPGPGGEAPEAYAW
jgi:aryl-alcohol dehydrogenase-like predicted oxidoreductase